MTNAFERKYAVLQDLQTKHDLAQVMNEFAMSQGFCYSNIMYVADKISLKVERIASSQIASQAHDFASQNGNGDAFFGINITNPSIPAHLLDNPILAQQDPVMQKAKRTSLPFMWNARNYEHHSASGMYEIMSSFGVRNGIASALHLPNGEHLMVSFDGPDLPSKIAKTLIQMLSEIQIFAAVALEPARRLLLEPQYEARRREFHLTAREVEVLKWSSEGKTADEIGQILGISASTATKHAANTIEKLGCINIKAALTKAFRSGLLR